MASAGVGVGSSVAVGEDTMTVDVAVVSGVDRGVVTGKRCLSGAQAEERTSKKQMHKPLCLYLVWLVITDHYMEIKLEFNGHRASTLRVQSIPSTYVLLMIELFLLRGAMYVPRNHRSGSVK